MRFRRRDAGAVLIRSLSGGDAAGRIDLIEKARGALNLSLNSPKLLLSAILTGFEQNAQVRCAKPDVAERLTEIVRQSKERFGGVGWR